MKTIAPLVLLAVTTVAWAQSLPLPDPSLNEPARPTSGRFEGDSNTLGGGADHAKAPTLIPLIKVENVGVGELMDQVSQQLKELGEPVPNIVFRNGVEERNIASLQVRRVSFEGLLNALGSIAGIEMEFLDNPGGEEIIVLKGTDPVHRKVGSGSTEGFGGGGEEAPASSFAALGRGNPGGEFDGGMANAPQMTRVFATSDLGVTDKDLMTTIQAVWDASDPDWSKGKSSKILFHEGTKMLVVKAAPDRLSEVDQVIRELNRVKERNENSVAMALQRRMEDLRVSGKRALEEAEQSQQRLIQEMEQNQLGMRKKIEELEIRLRESELSRARLRVEEKARDERR